MRLAAASLPVEQATWAVIDAEGQRRPVAIGRGPATTHSDTPPLESLYDTSPPCPGEGASNRVSRGNEYGNWTCAQAPGWQLLDRLLAEIRWLQYPRGRQKPRIRFISPRH
ncbi:MAG: hypothetical protein RMJ19_01295 [Gemmatales bacterium]|nr:hypothetical protein [Gemmatales bacterium]MCS7159081.1 hypothetical protein [Gemmatales bacterium]MDW8174281.1 hypothetical protein [Gemmatales bacterium]MDW8221998.1 hypothetical protein [Gemmatales bacterium]